ncbi:MAG: replicative DNA helicase, partial [Elusimicrobia bacterium]|nr:replicative DNA helicase [Elusimicrobiota bacterium]
MANLSDRLPPQALDAEMAVLGSMLIEKEAIEKAVVTVGAEHFYRDGHRIVFQTIKDLYDKGKSVDIVTVTEELKKKNNLADAGGEVYLSDLINKVSTAAHVEHYAEIVRQKATLRELIKASTEIVESCYKEDEEPETLVDRAEEKIFSVSQKQVLQGFYTSKELAHEVTEMIEKAHRDRNAITGVPSGFSRFDDMTGGFQKSDLIIIAARPSQGKTAMALNIAYHAAVVKKLPVAVFSVEMDRRAIMQRMVCSAAGANVHQVRTGMFERKKWTDLTREL